MANFKALKSSDREASIGINGSLLSSEDTKVLCYPNLKGLYFHTQFATTQADAETLLDIILDNKRLEMMNIYLSHAGWPLPYHKLVHGSFVSTTLRLLQIALPSLSEKILDLLGKGIQFNMVIEELSAYEINDDSHTKYAKLLLRIARTNIRILYNIPLDEVTFFCAAINLNHSNIISFYTWKCFASKPKVWWKYLIGATLKLQRDVAFPNRQHVRFFSDDGQKLLEVARGKTV